MENPNHPSDKQKAVVTPDSTQALQVVIGTPQPRCLQDPLQLPYPKPLSLHGSWARN
ncbi:UNVERIFIED_CONTAM: hypothetical protein Slati_1374900 [Sesamum latifolium]|uniref:Uncharacterized protein n=1 Tax=Sesamum latifolium TaxID=2727402 RepID=A0AAW2XK71_9LAMI